MKFSTLIVLLILVSSGFSQVTAVFQPGAANGKDAFVRFVAGCTPTSTLAGSANQNHGNSDKFQITAWTFNGPGCDTGTLRTFIEFPQINCIPSNATINSADLYLYGSSSLNYQNSNGITFKSNPYKIGRVLGAWNEGTITWNNQPNADYGLGITHPAATVAYQDDIIDVTALVDGWVQNTYPNNGMLLRLITEVHYRNRAWASSDNSDATLRPKLEVEYTIPNPPDASSNSPLCSGNDIQLTLSNGDPSYSYSWTGPNGFTSSQQNPTITNATSAEAGTYSVTVTTTCGGVVYTDNVNVTINTSLTATASSNSPVCAGQTLNLTSSGGTSYSWTGPNGFTSNQQNPSINNVTTAESGVYTVTATDAGCSGQATVNVTINSGPAASASSNGPVCVGGTLDLSSSGGTGYSWTGPNGFTSNQQNPSINNITTAESGTYTVTVNNGGCTNQATVNITVTNGPTATASSNGPVCAGQTLNLISSGGTSYSWTGPNGFTSSQQNPIINNAATVASGTYTVTVTDGGCTDQATVNVTINSGPSINVSSNAPLCTGETLNLTSSSGTGHSWTGPNGFTSSQQNPTINNIALSDTGMYVVNVSSGAGCASIDSVNVLVSSGPTAVASSNSPVCEGQTLNLSSSGGDTYTWSSSNGYSSGQQNPSISNGSSSDAGNYKVVVTDTYGCSDSTSINVEFSDSLVMDITGVDETCIDKNDGTAEIKLIEGSGPLYYSWLNGDTTATPSFQPGFYTVVVTNDANCQWQDTVEIAAGQEKCPESSLYIPNIFSPNGDGINDVFEVYGEKVQSLSMQIFDRWGKQVFYTTNLGQGWDGTYKNKPLNTAVFAYLIKVTFKDGTKKSYNGNVTLVRKP